MNMNTNTNDYDIQEQVCRLAESLKGDETLRKFPHDLRHQHQLKKLVDPLGHGSKCSKSSPEKQQLCRYPNCSQGKGLYRHICTCLKRDCSLCKGMLQLVKFHPKACTKSDCTVPCCSEMKEYYRKRMERRRRREKRRQRRQLRSVEQSLEKLQLQHSDSPPN